MDNRTFGFLFCREHIFFDIDFIFSCSICIQSDRRDFIVFKWSCCKFLHWDMIILSRGPFWSNCIQVDAFFKKKFPFGGNTTNELIWKIFFWVFFLKFEQWVSLTTSTCMEKVYVQVQSTPHLSIPIYPLLPFNVILEQMPFYALQPLWPKSDEQFFFMENRTLDPMERWQCRSRDDIWISCEN